MKQKYKIISVDLQKNLIEFLDEIQFDAAAEGDNESMQKVNFCGWAIKELLNSYDALVKPKNKPNTKSRDQYLDETFMDWNMPDMSDEEYEKLVDQFDGFLRSWEKEYNKKNPKKKPIHDRPQKPRFEDIAEYCSLEEISDMLLDDPELTNVERFDLYYESHQRVQREKENKRLKKGSKSLDAVCKELGITRAKGYNSKNDKKT